MQILAGFIMIVVGAFMVIKSEALLNIFGRIDFFEKYLGTEGGSRLGYKLIGILVIFFGILMVTGLVGGFLEWILSPILRVSQPIQQ